jgi:ABC-2 type transport system ATP-binding protein
MNNILELSGVNKKFDSFSLNNISFALPKGFIMGFIGHNGAGKTTTIKLILILLHELILKQPMYLGNFT